MAASLKRLQAVPSQMSRCGLLIAITATEVGKFLSIGISSVSRAIQRAEHMLRDRPEIRKNIDRRLKQ